MATTITSTQLVQSEDLDVEVDHDERGALVISAWTRGPNRELLFANVPGEKLSAVVDLVTQALAPGPVTT